MELLTAVFFPVFLFKQLASVVQLIIASKKLAAFDVNSNKN